MKQLPARSFLRFMALLVFSLACISLATYLRGFTHSGPRQLVTQLLTAEGRAVVEHLLSALGFMPTLVLLSAAVCWLLWWPLQLLLHRIGKRLQTAPSGWWVHPGEADFGTQVMDMLAPMAVVYVAFSMCWEAGQAYVSVYGHQARGYIQWGQVAADQFGSVLSVALGRRILDGHWPCWVRSLRLAGLRPFFS